MNLWSAFAVTAAAAPSSPALIMPAEIVTFKELASLSERCASALAAMDVKRSGIVALELPKRVISYALLLACLRSGMPYVFLDPRNPVERTAAVLERVRPAALFSSGTTSNPHGRTIRLADDETGWIGESPPVPPADVTGSDPAYVMFTSGSTGEPKGAVIPHQGILGLMKWAREHVTGGERAVFAGLNPLHFDNSVFDIYCGLLNGAALVPIETSEIANPAHWIRSVRRGGVTVLFAVPTLYLILDQVGLLDPKSLPGVTTFLFGGEGFPIAPLRAFKARFGSAARLINVYGPTETSCICSSVEIDATSLAEADAAFPPIGRMHPNFGYAILNEDGGDVAKGTVGELWIGGPHVGLGYYRNATETAKRFRQDPRQESFRSIFYRSGDLVSEGADGLLWFKGRADNQVKIRGHRIELEEIDLAVQSMTGVSRALALALEGPDGAELAVAFCADRQISLVDIEAHCLQRLPAYMHPSRVLQLDRLPTNANGKADRRAIEFLFQRAGGEM